VEKQVTNVLQFIESVADTVKRFAGDECRQQFIKRAYENEAMTFVTSNQADIKKLEE
jgi:hypothetical protein